jgi:hypothetical protein
VAARRFPAFVPALLVKRRSSQDEINQGKTKTGLPDRLQTA